MERKQTKGQRVESEDVEHPAALGICRECAVGRSLPIFSTVSPRWLRPVKRIQLRPRKTPGVGLEQN